jgi:hypothetical protein
LLGVGFNGSRVAADWRLGWFLRLFSETADRNVCAPVNSAPVGFDDAVPDLQVASAMVRVYVAGPFRAGHSLGMELNIRRAEIVSHAVFACGACAVCPHTQTRFFQGSLPDQTWIDATLAMMLGCGAVLVLPGWRESAGTRGEVAAARSLGMPVEFLPGDLYSLSEVERHYAVRAALSRIVFALPELRYEEDLAPWPE